MQQRVTTLCKVKEDSPIWTLTSLGIS